MTAVVILAKVSSTYWKPNETLTSTSVIGGKKIALILKPLLFHFFWVHPNVQHNQVEPPKNCFTEFFFLLPTSPMYLGQRVKRFKHVSAEITVFGDDKSSALARPLLSTLQKKQNQLTSHEMKSDGWVPRNCPLLSRDPQTRPVQHDFGFGVQDIPRYHWFWRIKITC